MSARKPSLGREGLNNAWRGAVLMVEWGLIVLGEKPPTSCGILPVVSSCNSFTRQATARLALILGSRAFQPVWKQSCLCAKCNMKCQVHVQCGHNPALPDTMPSAMPGTMPSAIIGTMQSKMPSAKPSAKCTPAR